MKRTKKEREREAAARAMRVAAALRWSDPPPEPDVPPPDSSAPYGTLTTGYVYNAHSRRVDVACSSAASHAVGRTDRTTSQQAISLYSTRLLALRALRAALECEFAEALECVDQEIEKEKAL